MRTNFSSNLFGAGEFAEGDPLYPTEPTVTPDAPAEGTDTNPDDGDVVVEPVTLDEVMFRIRNTGRCVRIHQAAKQEHLTPTAFSIAKLGAKWPEGPMTTLGVEAFTDSPETVHDIVENMATVTATQVDHSKELAVAVAEGIKTQIEPKIKKQIDAIDELKGSIDKHYTDGTIAGKTYFGIPIAILMSRASGIIKIADALSAAIARLPKEGDHREDLKGWYAQLEDDLKTACIPMTDERDTRDRSVLTLTDEYDVVATLHILRPRLVVATSTPIPSAKQLTALDGMLRQATDRFIGMYNKLADTICEDAKALSNDRGEMEQFKFDQHDKLFMEISLLSVASSMCRMYLYPLLGTAQAFLSALDSLLSVESDK